MPSREKLSEFAVWCGKHLTGDEKGQAQLFLDRLLHQVHQVFGATPKTAGGTPPHPLIGVAAAVRRLKLPAGGSPKKAEPPQLCFYDRVD